MSCVCLPALVQTPTSHQGDTTPVHNLTCFGLTGIPRPNRKMKQYNEVRKSHDPHPRGNFIYRAAQILQYILN